MHRWVRRFTTSPVGVSILAFVVIAGAAHLCSTWNLSIILLVGFFLWLAVKPAVHYE